MNHTDAYVQATSFITECAISTMTEHESQPCWAVINDDNHEVVDWFFYREFAEALVANYIAANLKAHTEYVPITTRTITIEEAIAAKLKAHKAHTEYLP